MDERIGAEYAGRAAEADEVSTARGQRGVEIPDAVEAERTRHVSLHARGGDQVDDAIHVGAVGAHDQAQRAIAAETATGETDVLDEGDGRAAGIDRAQAQGGAVRDGRSGRTKHAELIVGVRLTGEKQHTTEDGSLALIDIMTAEHQ